MINTICLYGHRSIIKSFEKYLMNNQYARMKELGDKFDLIDPLIDWEAFRSIIHEMYDNHTERVNMNSNKLLNNHLILFKYFENSFLAFPELIYSLIK